MAAPARLVGDCEIVSSRLGADVRGVIDLRPSSPQNRATKECRRVVVPGEDGDAFGCFCRAVWRDKLFVRNTWLARLLSNCHGWTSAPAADFLAGSGESANGNDQNDSLMLKTLRKK